MFELGDVVEWNNKNEKVVYSGIVVSVNDKSWGGVYPVKVEFGAASRSCLFYRRWKKSPNR